MPVIVGGQILVIIANGIQFVYAADIANNVALCYFCTFLALAGAYPIIPGVSFCDPFLFGVDGDVYMHANVWDDLGDGVDAQQPQRTQEAGYGHCVDDVLGKRGRDYW